MNVPHSDSVHVAWNVPHSDSVSQMSNFPFCQLFEDQKLYERCLLKILDIFFGGILVVDF